MTKRNPCGMKKIKTIFGSKVEMPNLFQHLKLSLRTVLMTVPNYLKTRTVPVFLKASLRALAKVVIAGEARDNLAFFNYLRPHYFECAAERDGNNHIINPYNLF